MIPAVMTPNADNDGPSDEEASSLASRSILRPPSYRDPPSKEEGEFDAVAKEQRGRHEGKIIEIAPPSHARYESFFPLHALGRSPSTSTDEAETKKEAAFPNDRMHFAWRERERDRRSRSRSRGDHGSIHGNIHNHKHLRYGGTPGRKQFHRARQVLVHYHPQMGDDGYESTLLLESSSSSSWHDKKHRGGFSSPPPPPPPPPLAFRRDDPAAKFEKQRNRVGGMHSRMIDDLRSLEGANGSGNDEADDAAAAARRPRRRALRISAEKRTRTARETRTRPPSPSEESGRTRRPSPPRGASPEREEGDIPLRRSAPRTVVSSPGGGEDGRLPDAADADADADARSSHRRIVAHMIQTNEPEKLSQLDRVMEKYSGREQELIAKLDLRYRKKRKKKKKKTTGGGDGDVSDKDLHVARHSPRKDRNALLTMQNWDRKQDEKEDGDDHDDEDKKHERRKRHGSTVTIAPEQDEHKHDSSFLAVSARTSSTRTELHSNLERDLEDSEGRLPRVPESEAKVPDESEATEIRRHTPTRTKDGEHARHGSPGFNDDISLITMETKGTLYRNRGEGGGREPGGEGKEGIYSYAEMMRRPPASIIVDGNANAQPTQESPASEEKDLDENADSDPRRQRQLGPPKIQRLLPEYEKISEQERANAAEASQMTSAILDSVEARIRARHELRREEEARKSKYDETGPSTMLKERNAPEEHPTVAFDEEESFVGKANSGGQERFRGVIEHGSSLIDDEANRRGAFDGVDRGGKEEKAVEEVGVTQASREEEDSFPGKSHQYERGYSFREPGDKHDVQRSARPVSAHFFEKALSLDAKNDRESVEEDQGPSQLAKMTVEDALNGHLAQKQREEEQARAIQEAARRDAEIQLQKMQDEIARLVAEKESRFAAEKAVALRKAEKALEEERKARLEAEEARLKAERELERVKAEAEERAALMEAAKVAELLRAEEEKTSDMMIADAKKRTLSIVEESVRSMSKTFIEEKEESMPMNDNSSMPMNDDRSMPMNDDRSIPMDEDRSMRTSEDRTMPTSEDRSMPINEDSEEKYAAKNSVAIEKSMSMDAETKEELMLMIAEMEERAASQSKNPLTVNETEDNDQAYNEDDDSVDIVEKMRSVWALDEDESKPAEYAACSYDDSEYETQDDRVAEWKNSMDGNEEDDSHHSDDHSYLPGSLQSSPERKSMTISKDLHDFPSLTMPQGPLNLASPEDNIQLPRIFSSKNDHDFPSMTMPHQQVSVARILDLVERESPEAKIISNLQHNLPRRPSVLDEEEGEANIYHVARVAFDGDPSKGQLSFTTGSEVLAHSNQRGDWWLGRCGGRTGWFPASAVVPASEFLRGPVDITCDAVQNTEDDDDIDVEFPKLSEEELNNVYDFIRSPSGDDDTPKKLGRYSTPSSPILETSQSLALKEWHESTEQNEGDVRHAFDSMMNVYGSMVTPASARSVDQPINRKEQPSLVVSGETKQTEANQTKQTKANQEQPAPNGQEKKPKRLWRSALDPNTGLTYYYNVKTRETTWDRPPDFVEKKPAATSPSSVESKPVEQESGPKDATAKEPLKSGSKRLLALFAKPSARRSDRKASHPTAPQSTKPTNDYQVETKNHATNHSLSSPYDNTTNLTYYHQTETKNYVTKDIVSSHYDDSEEDDVSSVSSEETSTSIFSTKRMREVIVKVTSKIAGKITTIATNNSYDVLDDSDSRQLQGGVKNVQIVEKLPATNADEETKEEIRPRVDRDRSNRQVKSNPYHATMTSASDATAIKPASYGKNTDSRWRAAIDPLTGRTYFFHKDTQETVWKKPENL